MSTQSEPQSEVMDLRGFVGVLRRRKWTILFVTLLVLGLALGFVYWRAPTYTATAEVSVEPRFSDQVVQGLASDSFVNMDTESRLITSDQSILAAAAADGNLALDADSVTDLEALSSRISVSVPAGTTILSISCTDGSAEFARDCANAVATAYAEHRVEAARTLSSENRKDPQARMDAAQAHVTALTAELQTVPQSQRALIEDQITSWMTVRDNAQQELDAIPTANPAAAEVVLSAQMPTAPSNKDYLTTGALAAILGLMLGIAIAFVRERLDEHITGREVFEDALGAPVLAVVPHVTGWGKKKESRVITRTAPTSPASESYRAARTILMYLASQGDMKVIAVTGPGQDEGKSTTTANLAVALAKAGRLVLAMSCDLRKPRLHRFFDLENDLGLSAVLTGRASLKETTKRTATANLWVLPSGPVPEDPAELLSSEVMHAVLAEMREHFDFILLDTAPALVVADASSLAQRADGVLIVADAARTTPQAVAHVRREFERVGGRIIGGVLNNLDPKHAKRYAADYRTYYGGLAQYETKASQPEHPGNGHPYRPLVPNPPELEDVHTDRDAVRPDRAAVRPDLEHPPRGIPESWP